jgi:collagen type I alpha
MLKNDILQLKDIFGNKLTFDPATANLLAITFDAITTAYGTSATTTYDQNTGILTFEIPAGIPGATGAQGSQGATGAQGTQGATGAQGSPGATGAQGSQGATGAQGSPGATGAQGSPGATGAQGSPGATGAQGSPGATGLDVDHISKTAGTGAAGTTDIYTVWQDLAETIPLGTFQVYNGSDGTGAGDMLKSQYDTDNSGVVDNAEKVNGLVIQTAVPLNALFTDTTYSVGDSGLTEKNFTAILKAKLDEITATATELNFSDGVTSNIQTQFAGKAPLSSPALTDIPTAPTAATGTNTTQLATTAFVTAGYAQKDTTTGVVFLGSGTTLQRPTLLSTARAMWYNTDLSAFEGWNGTTWGTIGGGGGATGGGTDAVFVETSYTVTQDYTITADKSAITVGDANGNVTINDGITITIPDGASWVVVGA